MSPPSKLPLDVLKKGLPGVSPARGTNHFEAAIVRFYQAGHKPGVILQIKGDFSTSFDVIWAGEVDDQILRSWNDPEETTEFAACGIAFLLILELTDYTVIKRSRKGTGFDYWLGDKDDMETLPFQDKARLEVSGIREEEKESKIRARAKQKLQQSEKSNTHLPAYAVVVEFGIPLSYMVTSK